ncbi:hypothetical protein BC567DRAFT_280884 [Phyllosticta citribraziliensis]
MDKTFPGATSSNFRSPFERLYFDTRATPTQAAPGCLQRKASDKSPDNHTLFRLSFGRIRKIMLLRVLDTANSLSCNSFRSASFAPPPRKCLQIWLISTQRAPRTILRINAGIVCSEAHHVTIDANSSSHRTVFNSMHSMLEATFMVVRPSRSAPFLCSAKKLDEAVAEMNAASSFLLLNDWTAAVDDQNSFSCPQIAFSANKQPFKCSAKTVLLSIRTLPCQELCGRQPCNRSAELKTADAQYI